jgi:secondary thiamine-phosphate synthase enzyme
MIKKISISTRSQTELVDITSEVADIVRESRVKSGVCHIFVPHTTAGITINENADPSVRRDILNELNKLVPIDGDYEHSEGNAAAHIKSTIVGTDKTIFIEGGELKFGTWQGVYFLEFDGPRQRNVLVKIMER